MKNGSVWIPPSFYLSKVWSKTPLSQESPTTSVAMIQMQSLTYNAQVCVLQPPASSQKPSVVFRTHNTQVTLKFTVGIFTYTLNMVEKYQVVAKLF